MKGWGPQLLGPRKPGKKWHPFKESLEYFDSRGLNRQALLDHIFVNAKVFLGVLLFCMETTGELKLLKGKSSDP